MAQLAFLLTVAMKIHYNSIMSEKEKMTDLKGVKDLLADLTYFVSMAAGMNSIKDIEAVADLLQDALRTCHELNNEIVIKEFTARLN